MRTLLSGFVTLACAGILALTGCTASAEPTVLLPTSPPTSQLQDSVDVSDPSDQLASWTIFARDDYLVAAAKTMGLQGLYPVSHRILNEQFGGTYSYVGIYGPTCMVALGFDTKYEKLRLNQIAEANVTILSRYNPVTFWVYRENVKIAGIKGMLASQADHCR